MPRLLLVLIVVGCAAAPPETEPPTTATTTSTTTITTTSTTTTTTTTVMPLPDGVMERPDWLGTRVLPLRSDGYGKILPTPPEMVDRRFATPDLLPPPRIVIYESSIQPVPDEVVARSTWREECPVALDDLSYLTMTFWGFDQMPHTGEMIVASEVAEDVVEVFRKLYEARFPIEEMRVIRMDDLEAEPTGDGNVTSGFTCRHYVAGKWWSRHAVGLAIDINPFHNPYVVDDLVIPELASTYVDRTNVRPGMVVRDDVVVQAFADMGWFWGGYWSAPDYMHFSHDWH